MNDLDLRSRIMGATTRCAEINGVRGFSMEDVAAEASVSRATIYRYFPDGRSQLMAETVTWEVGRFWSRLADAVASYPTLEDRLVAGLVIGRKLMAKSRILANLADPDVRELLEAAQPSESLVHGVIRAFMRSQLEEELDAGRLRVDIELETASDYLARMTLSWMGNSPGLNLADEPSVRRLVRSQFMGALSVRMAT